MKPLYRNILLAIGIVAIGIMLWTFDMSWSELWQHIRMAGWWFPAVVLLWVPIYMINAAAWYVIINDSETPKIGFWRVCKYTISGYALNYVTPVGVLGGEPYRIMELTPYVGTAKATSSVLLYAMMHIFSHFCFWTASLVLLALLYGSTLESGWWVVLGLTAAFCATGIYFFMMGYQNGLAMKTLSCLRHLPWIGRPIQAFAQKNEEAIQRIDSQIAALHAQRKSTFYLSLSLEFIARVVGCLELMFCLLIITDNISFLDCVLMQAFTSLFANLVFFIPMQMGTREGSMALFTGALHMNGAFGVLTSLIVRLREIVWIAIGLLLLKAGNNKQMNKPSTEE